MCSELFFGVNVHWQVAWQAGAAESLVCWRKLLTLCCRNGDKKTT